MNPAVPVHQRLLGLRTNWTSRRGLKSAEALALSMRLGGSLAQVEVELTLLQQEVWWLEKLDSLVKSNSAPNGIEFPSTGIMGPFLVLHLPLRFFKNSIHMLYITRIS